MVLSVRNLPPVADNVHSSDDLADGEETENLSGGDTGKCDLLGVGAADAVQDVLRREGAGRGVAGGVEEVLEVGLEGSQVGRGHVLATENQLAELKSDSRVVDGRGYHRLDKRNDLSGSSTNFLQSTTETLGSVREGRASRRSNTRETLRGL